MHSPKIEIDDGGHSERLAELLTAQAVEGLTVDEDRELESLLSGLSAEERALWHRTVAATELAMMSEPAEQPLTPELRARLIQVGTTGRANDASPTLRLTDDPELHAAMTPAAVRRRGRILAFSGWAAAAAAMVVLGVVVVKRQPEPWGLAQRQAAADQRLRERIQNAPDLVRVAFAPTVDELKGVTGEVIWSDEFQTGYMTFRGLAVNDPKLMQYQLWIVDPKRDKHPVDGGVFDVTSAGEVTIKIERTLDVRNPAAFAITREKPGGVVVSAGPLVLVAKGG